MSDFAIALCTQTSADQSAFNEGAILPMTRTLYIHIGMHKTGSSSIQKSFDDFESDTITYIKLARPNHSATYSTVFMQKPERFIGHKRKKRSVDDVMLLRARQVQRLEQSIAQGDGRDMITSAESISLLERDEVASMRDFFARYFTEIKVLAYVRPPASYMASALQQRIFGGLRVEFDSLYPGYRRLFEKFDEVFGRDNVVLCKFDRQQLKDSNVVCDFADRVGVTLEPERIVEANVGLKLESAAILHAHRRFGKHKLQSKKERADNARVAATIGAIGTTKLQLHKRFVLSVLEKNKDDIAWIEDRLGQSLSEDYSSDKQAIASVDRLMSIAGSQLPVLGRIIADEIASTRDDPKLAALAVDLLYSIYARQRLHRRSSSQA